MPKMNYTLHLGDALEYIKTMSLHVDAVITDPPYGMKKADWDMQTIDITPILSRFDNVALFCGVKGIHDYPKSNWTMAWVRSGSTQRNGSYKGFNNWEPILIYGYDSISNDVLSVANVPDNNIDHPTKKPIKLMRMMVERLTHPGQVIFDPFMGSGTTGVAAIQLGRKFIGCEINPEYFAIAERRIAQAALQPGLFTASNLSCTGTATPQGKQPELFTNSLGSDGANSNAVP